ncbi:MAG TPA: MDR family MFS transporter [Acidimicrobiales bacterium]|nr:MDR family MFS transporter [Acidimicrobiales bacterium]
MSELATSMPAGERLTTRQIHIIFAGILTGLALSALDATIVNTALTTIVGDLGGLDAYTWIGTSYLLTTTAATPLFGKLSDLYGRRQLFQAAILTFMLGSLACGLAPSMGALVLARAVQGIGGGGLNAMAFVIIGDVVPPRERGRYAGFITSVYALASVAGPLLGGFFVDHLTWRWIFLINVPLGIVALVVTTSSLRLPFARRDHAIDWWGAVSLVLAVSLLVLALSWSGEHYGWTHAATLGLLAGSATLTAAFVWWEGRAREPILPLRLFGDDTFRVTMPMMLCLGAVMFGSAAFLPLFLQGVTGVSPTASGLLMVPLMGGVTVAAIGAGKITTRTGRYRLWPILGSALGAVGVLGLCFLDDSGTGLAVALVSMILVGAGFGLIMPTSALAVQNTVAWEDLGIATSMVTFFRSLGGVVGLAAFGAVLNAQIGDRIDPALVQAPREIRDLPDDVQSTVLDVLADAITAVFKTAVPLMLIALVLAFRIREVPLRETSPLQQASAADAA